MRAAASAIASFYPRALSAEEEVFLIRQSRRAVQRNFPQSTQLSQPASTSSLDWKRRTRIPRNKATCVKRVWVLIYGALVPSYANPWVILNV